MLKKISYLASVSVLASVIMGSAGYAVHEEELGLIIKSFKKQTVEESEENSAEPATKEKEEKSPDVNDSWWGYVSYVGSALKPVANGTGNLLRWTGDQVRGDSVVGDILTEKGLGIVSQYGGSPATAIIDKVGEKESSASSVRKTAGNAVRWIGACLVQETPTLERTLRQFWIEKREADDADQAITSTACALYLFKEHIGGVDGVKNSFRKFIKAWNSGTYTVHSEDAETNHEYFLKGLIRGFARDKKHIQNFEDIAVYTRAFSIDYENLSVTKKITAESVVEKDENLGDVTLRRIQQARKEAFMNFVLGTFETESEKLIIDKVNSVEDAHSQLLLENGSDTEENPTKEKKKKKKHVKKKVKKKEKKRKKEKEKDSESDNEEIKGSEPKKED